MSTWMDSLLDRLRRTPSEQIVTVNSRPFLVGDGPQTTVALIEDALDRPLRVQERREFLSLDSLADYLARYQTADTVIFANVDTRKIRAVLDFHPEPESGEAEAAFCDHSAVFEFPASRQWKAWAEMDGAWFSQEAFSEFLEEHALDIFDPEAARMLEIARSLDARRDVTFSRSIRQESGDVQFEYRDETLATTGSVSVPERFRLKIPVFRGGAVYEIDCRLRYRVREGALAMGYQILQREEIVEDAFNMDFRAFRDKLDGLGMSDIPVYHAHC